MSEPGPTTLSTDPTNGTEPGTISAPAGTGSADPALGIAAAVTPTPAAPAARITPSAAATLATSTAADGARAPPAELTQLANGLQQLITLLGRVNDYAALAQDLPLIGSSVGDVVDIVSSLQQSLTLINSYLTTAATPTLQGIAELLSGQTANQLVTVTVDANQLALAIKYRTTRTLADVPLNLGTPAATSASRSTPRPTSTGSFALDFTIGVTLADDAFFARIDDLTAGVKVSVTGLNANVLLGPVQAGIANGSIELSAQGKLPFTGPMTIAQLAATDLSTLTGALQLTSNVTATLPLRLDLSGLQLPENAALKLDTADLFSGQLSVDLRRPQLHSRHRRRRPRRRRHDRRQ